MQSILAAFPQRPLTLSDAGVRATWLNYFGIILGAVLAYFLCVWLGADLVRDHAIRANPVLVEDWKLSKGECTTHKGIATNCDVRFSYIVDGTRHEAQVDIAFLSFGGRDYEVEVIRDGNDPSRATLDLALDHYWNRVLTFLGFLGLLIGLSAFSLVKLLQARAVRRAARRTGPVTPVAVTVTNVERTWAYLILTYVLERPGGAQLTRVARFRKKSDPFYLSAAPDDTSALAVVPHGSDIAIPLTEALDTIDLTDAERDELRAARQRQAEAEAA